MNFIFKQSSPSDKVIAVICAGYSWRHAKIKTAMKIAGQYFFIAASLLMRNNGLAAIICGYLRNI
jgi:hypothetical protein